jgi:hypothetical protein
VSGVDAVGSDGQLRDERLAAIDVGALDLDPDSLGQELFEVGIVRELEHPPRRHRRDRLVVLIQNGLLQVVAEDELERQVNAPRKVPGLGVRGRGQERSRHTGRDTECRLLLHDSLLGSSAGETAGSMPGSRPPKVADSKEGEVAKPCNL